MSPAAARLHHLKLPAVDTQRVSAPDVVADENLACAWLGKAAARQQVAAEHSAVLNHDQLLLTVTHNGAPHVAADAGKVLRKCFSLGVVGLQAKGD